MERFLRVATRRLEDRPELREVAKGELMARLSHRRGGVDRLDVAGPLARLEAAGRDRAWRRWTTTGLLLALVAALAATVYLVSVDVRLFRESLQFGSTHRYGRAIDLSEGPLIRMLRREAPELPLGLDSESFASASDESAVLLMEHPDDPELLRFHVMRLLGENDGRWEKLPKDIVERLRESDPDLGDWRGIRISQALREARENGSASAWSREKVSDPVAYERARVLWREEIASLDDPEETGPGESVLDLQTSALPEPDDLLSLMAMRNCARPFDPRYTRSSVYVFLNYAQTEAERLRKAGDRDALERLSRELRKLVKEPRFAPMLLRGYGIFNSNGELTKALSDFSLHHEVAEWKRLGSEVTFGSPGLPEWSEDGERARPALIKGLAHYLPMMVGLEELEPLRRAEFALADRVAVLVGALFFALMALVTGIEACRRKAGTKGLARGLVPLLDWRDHLWIGIMGLLVPLALRLGLVASPWGLRDFGIPYLDSIPWMLQTVLGLLFSLATLVAAVNWRWSRRGGFLDIGGRGVLWSWLAAGLIGLSSIAVGAVRHIPDVDDRQGLFLMAVASCGGLGLLWFLWLGIAVLFQAESTALGANLSARTLLPWFAATALGLLALAPLAHAAEKRWLAKDQLMRDGGSMAGLIERRTVERIDELLKEFR